MEKANSNPELIDDFPPPSFVPLDVNVLPSASKGQDELADDTKRTGAYSAYITKSRCPWVLQTGRSLLGVLGEVLVAVPYAAAEGFLTDNNSRKNAPRLTNSHGRKEYHLTSSLNQFNDLRYHPTGRECIAYDFGANHHAESTSDSVQSASGIQSPSLEHEGRRVNQDAASTGDSTQSVSGLQPPSVEPKGDPYIFDCPPFEPISEMCQLCGWHLSREPEEYHILPCGHCVHVSCAAVIYGRQEPSQVPPCIHC